MPKLAPIHVVVWSLFGALSAQPIAVGAVDWSAYGSDPGGSRYSSLTQINRENVTHLKVAWVYRTGEAESKAEARKKAAFEATPILVQGTLYFSTPFNRVIALNPVSGRARWTYDPKVDLSRDFSEVTCRGVSAWVGQRSGERAEPRIFVATIDARLIALNATSGTPCKEFGNGGQVDLKQDVRLVNPGHYQVTSPPAVIGDLAVVGSSIGDNRGVELERGVVRAYDVRTGKLRWSWDPIPRDSQDPARGTWAGKSAEHTGAANAWSVISADRERGLVFIPTSSPSPDYYGGERLGSNLYANCVVALRADTGKMVWSFQVVHHDLWDYDVASQPTLLSVRRDGLEIPAVAVATKMGRIFLLHRETGKPLFPVEERAVPRSDVAGEEASPTQPFPTLPLPLGPQKITAEDAWGPTPQDCDWCRERIKALRAEGTFTPPSLGGSLVVPSSVGGMHWGGLSCDLQRGLLIANINRLVSMVKLIPREEYDQQRKTWKGDRVSGEFAPQKGTPYAMYREFLLSPSGTPCNPPPWGTLAAIDVSTGVLKWEVPLGTFARISRVPGFSEAWGSPNLGGSMVTAGGLVFISAAMDTYLRAFDIDTGKELWKAELPASAQATPMTCSVGEGGKQFIVIAAGGHGKLGTKMGDHVVAFALP